MPRKVRCSMLAALAVRLAFVLAKLAQVPGVMTILVIAGIICVVVGIFGGTSTMNSEKGGGGYCLLTIVGIVCFIVWILALAGVV